MADLPSGRDSLPEADFDLSIPDDVLSLVERFLMEWYNGGLAQLFSNWNAADIVLIPEALRLIGAAEAAPLIAAAIDAFPADRIGWRERGNEAMLDPAAPLGDQLWALDHRIAEHETAIMKAVEAFELKLSDDEDEKG